MSDFVREFTIRVYLDTDIRTLTYRITSTKLIRDLVVEILAHCQIIDDIANWEVICEGQVFLQENRVEQILGPILILQRREPSIVFDDDIADEADFDIALDDSELAQDEVFDSQAEPVDSELAHEEDQGDDFLVTEEELDGSIEEVEDAAPASDVLFDAPEEEAVEFDDAEVEERKVQPIVTARTKKASTHLRESSSTETAKPNKIGTRVATVRHYDRMHKERVYPFFVVISKDMIEKVAESSVTQKSSGPIKVDENKPLEIEPMIPGCICSPAKRVVRLRAKSQKVTFYVVPHVLGTIEGASVAIRQNKVTLTKIELEIKVVRQIWFWLSAAATILLPMLSGILKHFRLDFETQMRDGFDLYLAIARFFAEYTTTLNLSLVLALITALVFWITRSRSKEAFAEFETISPQRKLEKIASLAVTNSIKASEELLELMRIFPQFWPARIHYSEWHYNLRNYKQALDGYVIAFKLKTSRGIDYLRASLAASQLNKHRQALTILEEAETKLPAKALPAVIFFNMACYHTRLKQYREAMTYLRRAVRNGYMKLESFQNDPDLAPLRNRPEFAEILTAVAGHVRSKSTNA